MQLVSSALRPTFHDTQVIQRNHQAALAMVALEGLQFDNTVLRVIDVDAGPPHEPRQVRNAIYAYVNPTTLNHPKLIAVSHDALELLGLDPSETDRDEFTEVMAGNKILPGMQPAAHCYAGYQFGYFSGQLGDGAAIYLGEVIHPVDGLRNELQLKGSGLTPFSRAADGRKVLRSSMREFLASEAMHALGIPTTRAGSLVVSGSDKVMRDIHYTGDPQLEPCAVVSRIAPSFVRFGSFEICKSTDPVTGRSGPSSGAAARLLLPLLGYTIKQHYEHIWNTYSRDDDVTMSNMEDTQVLDMVESWFIEVCRRTAHLVAGWQSVGFVHGVLNTDNMSILGLTLDYGPYGFMDRFNSKHVSNGSDDGARYTYEAQPAICYWNLQRLAEALEKTPLPSAAAAAAGSSGGVGSSDVHHSGGGSVLPAGRARKGLTEYDQEFARQYRAIFRRKLGLVGAAGAAAAAAAQDGGSSSTAAAAAAAAERPTYPLSSNASLAVAAAAAAVTAAAPDAAADVEDDALIKDLLDLMDNTGADFTNTFRKLAAMPFPQPSSSSSSNGSSTESNSNNDAVTFDDVLSDIVDDMASPAEMAAASKPTMPAENIKMLLMLAGRDAALLHSLGLTPQALQQQLAAHTAAAKWRDMTLEDKQTSDRQQWNNWLNRYKQRLQQEADAGVTSELHHAVMSASNPRVVLRNWVAQAAILSAENGQYAKVRHILDVLRRPFDDTEDAMQLEVPAPVAAAAAAGASSLLAAAAVAAPAGSVDTQKAVAAAGGDDNGGVCPLVRVQLDGKPPSWAAGLCVTCSS